MNLAAQVAAAQGARGTSAPVTPTAVQSSGASAQAIDIRDIRGPKAIASPWPPLLIALTVLTATGGAYAAWAWNRRRFREASKRPLDLALDRLDKARLLMLPQRGRDFSIEVSGAIRDYIERSFDLRAAHLTTDEFLREVQRQVDAPLAAHRSLLDDFLQTCDLAKFGGWNLATADMETMMQAARRFVVESAESAAHRPPVAADPRPDQRPTSTPRETYVSLPST
jgi:hypothetical protein